MSSHASWRSAPYRPRLSRRLTSGVIKVARKLHTTFHGHSSYMRLGDDWSGDAKLLIQPVTNTAQEHSDNEQAKIQTNKSGDWWVDIAHRTRISFSHQIPPNTRPRLYTDVGCVECNLWLLGNRRCYWRRHTSLSVVETPAAIAAEQLK